jgi:YD repeat-containing protein
MRRLLLLALLLAPGLAAAQPVPEALQGAWFQGDCARPDALLHLTHRAAARVPRDGAGRLLRFQAMRQQEGWLIGTGRGAQAPRLMLRAAGDALETAEPDAKAREDRLPGDAPLARWHRCGTVPPEVALLHGEGVAVMAALEHVEAACGGADGAACFAAVVKQADVSGDSRLARAELARLARGAAWLVAVQEGVTGDKLAGAVAAGALAGQLAAQLTVESLDYDGDGRLSAEELAQDRGRFGMARGNAEGRPLHSEAAGPGLEALRGLLSGLSLLK